MKIHKQLTTHYANFQLPPVDPLDAVKSLVDEGLARNYWIYASKDETYVALNPIGELAITGDQIQAKWDGKVIASEKISDLFGQSATLLSKMPIDEWRAFGYVAFDAASYYYSYPLSTSTSAIKFIIPRTELKISKDKTELRTIENAEQVTKIIESSKPHIYGRPNAPRLDFSDKKIYEKRVAEIIKDIHAGPLAKVILARQVKLPGSIDIFSTYASIRAFNPASRTYCFKEEELTGIGSSPELLMKTTKDGTILTNPLAGTRSRGSTKENDDALRNTLLNDSKEIKEHVMSIMVAQEELESICTDGSVCIKKFMRVAHFRTVQHLSSSVTGKLLPKNTLWDGLKALFPGVTASGIDKRTAIAKIAALEQKSRGVYAGCVGWVSFDGASDLAITLRSAFEDSKGVTISAGAGIIAESIPEHEYEETVNKMRTIHSQLVLMPKV